MNLGKRTPRLGTLSALALSALALGGIRNLNFPTVDARTPTDEEVEKHKRFLAMLPGPNARSIWQRRFRRGLTPSEAKFIAERLEESEDVEA